MAEWIDTWRVQTATTHPDHLTILFQHGFVKKGTSNIATFTDGRKEINLPRECLCMAKKEALAKAREAARIILKELERQSEEAERE